VWFKSALQDGTEVGFGWSHEEAIIEMMKQYIKSYKDLPASVYQFQTKLRNELRAKSGIMRGREFVMKDMYSMHTTAEDCDAYYEKVIEAYKRIYDRLGIGDSTFVTFASGGAFTKFSHEFQTICPAGEDTLYVNEEQTIAVNEEVLDDAAAEMGIDKTSLKPVVSAEVGNIFKFGTEKSEQMGFNYTGEDGQQHPIYLASYGVGVTRVMGVVVEKFADDKGIVWPEALAPARVYLVQIGQESVSSADELYKELGDRGIDVIYDDRNERPGAKFADAELMGIPYRVTVSDRLMGEQKYEFTSRATGETELLTHDELLAKLS
jgi:prolyl-tRNA synthetase